MNEPHRDLLSPASVQPRDNDPTINLPSSSVSGIQSHGTSSSDGLSSVSRRISKCRNSNSFLHNKQRIFNNISTLIDAMSDGGTSNSEPIAAQYFLEYFSVHTPNSYNKSQTKHDAANKHRPLLSPVQTAALLTDLDISDYAGYSVLNRHVRHATGKSLLCPKSQLKKYSTNLPPLMYSTYMWKKDENKKKEKVLIAQSEMGEVIKKSVSDYLIDNRTKLTKEKANTLDPLFSYVTQVGDGIVMILGTDHGQEHAQFVLQLNLESSKYRRNHNSTTAGTTFANFGKIKSTTDSYDIIKLTSDNVNEGCKLLQDHMLLAVKCDNEQHCLWVPKISTKFEIERCGKLISFDKDGKKVDEYLLPAVMRSTDVPIETFCVFKDVCKYVCTDLSAEFLLQGRGSKAHTRCIKCLSNRYEWQIDDKEEHVCIELLTDEMMEDAEAGFGNEIGLDFSPLWKFIGIGFFLLPLMHIMMGTVNDTLFKGIISYAMSLTIGCEKEEAARVELVKVIKQWNKNIRRMKEINLAIPTNRKNKLSLKRRIAYRVRKLKKPNVNVGVVQGQLDALKIELVQVIRDLKDLIKEMSDLNETRSDLRVSKSALYSKVSAFRKERQHKEDGMDTAIARILTKHGVTIQAYHGGSLTGVACKSLCRNAKEIMSDIIELCETKIKEREEDNSPLRPPSVQHMLTKMNLFQDLLVAQDAMYSSLRVLNPSKAEIKEAKERVKVFKKLWQQAKLPVTPKVHLVCCHAVSEMERIGGYGDKNDEPVEKYHQIQKKLDHRLYRMVPGKARFEAQQRYEARANNGEVKSQRTKMYRESSYKKKRSRSELKSVLKKVAKREERVVWKDEKIVEMRDGGTWSEDEEDETGGIVETGGIDENGGIDDNAN